MTSVKSVMQVELVEFNMAKQKNHNGKMSHCTNKKPRDPEAIKIWKKRLDKNHKM